MKLRTLETALCEVKTFDSPVVELEQYATSAHLAAQVAHTMRYTFDDISDKFVCDLGCGTGMLAIASAMLGAQFVVGIDVDDAALQIAQENVREMEVEEQVDFSRADITAFDFIRTQLSTRVFDTVFMNPPFGTKRKGVDMVFLQTAVQLAKTAVYSMHKSSTRDYILKKAESWGVKAQVLAELRFDIGQVYKFHKAKSVDVAVDLWRIDTTNAPSPLTVMSVPLQSTEEVRAKLNYRRQHGNQKRNRGGRSSSSRRK